MVALIDGPQTHERPPAEERVHRADPPPDPNPPGGKKTASAVPDPSATLTDQVQRCIAKLEDEVSGLLGAAVVDQARGTSMYRIGSTLDIEVASSGGAELLVLKKDLLERLNLGGSLEEILTITNGWFCILHPVDRQRFLYVIVDRKIGNLAMARRFVSSASAELSV
ncbi:MAG: hypothetical protein KUG77_19695 [Nannocystaceae bacterium]|nr:hypothetical protein [Nannocystaceae bacterium]